MNLDRRTLDEDRLRHLRGAITVTAASELAASSARPSSVPARTPARLALAGLAAVVLAVGLVVGVGALGDGAVGPTPAAATVEEVGDRVVISLFDEEATAAEVAAILEGAGIETELVLYEPGPNGPVPADDAVTLAAAQTNPVSTMWALALDADDVANGEIADGVVQSLSFRVGSDVTVQLVFEP